MANLFNSQLHELSPDDVTRIMQRPHCLSDDSRPVPAKQRSWGGWDFFTLWLGMMVSIPVYMLASGLVAKGMTWWQAVLVIVLGHLIVMIPAVALGHFGSRYGASFAMLSKLIFGPVGNYLPTMIRAVLGCFWFGIQCWIGGQAVDAILNVVTWQLWSQLPIHLECAFALFFLSNVAIAYYGASGIRYLQNIAAPVLVFLGIAVVLWALDVADWQAETLFSVVPSAEGGNFWLLFLPALSAMIAFDGTLALNTSDFTRNAKSQQAQFWGQLLGAPLMTLFICLVGVIGTNGSILAFGEAIWNPAELVARFDHPLIVLFFSIFIVIATLTTNVAGNLIPPGMVFTSLFASRLNYRRAIFTAALLSLLGQPWSVLADPDNYIFVVLGNLAAFLGPMAGIYMAGYWFEHRTKVDLVDLYLTHEGRYYYSHGFNISALAVLLLVSSGCIVSQFVPGLQFLFDNSYVLGAVMAFVAYALIVRSGVRRLRSPVELS